MLGLLERWDHQLFFAINNGWSMPGFDYLFWTLATFGDGLGLVLIAGLGLWSWDREGFWRHWGWIIVAVVAGAVVVQVIKYGISRPRPLTTFAPLLESGKAYINVVGQPLQHRAFPSGHTQAAASVLVYLVWLYPRYWIWWGGGLVLAGLGRIYVGAHFPSDVVVGALFGGLSAMTVAQWRRRRDNRAMAATRSE